MQRAIEKPVHLLESLAQIVGTEHLLTDDESRIFFSTDVYRQADELAVAIAQPGTVEELHEAVRRAALRAAEGADGGARRGRVLYGRFSANPAEYRTV
jgi:hypothetical protein